MNKQGSKYRNKKMLVLALCGEGDKIGALGECLGLMPGRLLEDEMSGLTLADKKVAAVCA